MSSPLFDEKTRRKLEQLTLMASRVRAGAIKGERRSTKRGVSIEFADYRDYAPGDDLRRVDWNVYARLDRPLTKLFEDEEDLAVHLILDASASMDYPPRDGEGADPAAHKFDYARRLIAGLGTVALTTNDRLTISAVGGGAAHFGPARGRPYGARMLQFLTGVRPGGQVDFNAALRNYALQARRPGLCLIVSDLFAPAGILDGLNALAGRGYEVGVIHLLSPEEIEPPLSGDLRLVDSETGEVQEVSLDGSMRELYMRRLEAWRDELRADCQKRGVAFIPVTTSAPWEKVILYDLRRLGLVK
ncbi:MAG: DUF58 domain-containing protein [Anaerolineae bacterium]|nr:DUF58 domain-containing protein [Anaerolineae bacterium]